MDVNEMQAGRELDTLIAEKVMGYTLNYEFAIPGICLPTIDKLRDKYDEWGEIPWYSTDMNDAWQVVDKLCIHTLRRIVNDEPDSPSLWEARIYARDELAGIADTAPLAICRAALKALVAA